jgi:hypothetical protein
MTEKSAKFHELAQKRVATLTDQIRIFSNLSGPSYDWSAEEVWAYFSQVTEALETALGRFQEQKRWGAQPSSEEPAPEPPEEIQDQEAEEIAEPLDAGAAKQRRRQQTIGDLILAAKNDPNMLPEMLAMQKEVIANLQGIINELRDTKYLS